jgi:hypothetical protein
VKQLLVTNFEETSSTVQPGSVVRRAPGFVLGELLVFVVLLTAASMVFLPMALKERQVENAEHAREYLRMISASEQVWRREMGVYVDLRRLAESVPSPPERGSHLRTPGMSFQPPMIFDGHGIAHRGGYRFLVGTNEQGRAVGCWAWPNLCDYSGQDTYWVDFANGVVSISPIAASWNDTPGSLAPEAVGLRPIAD